MNPAQNRIVDPDPCNIGAFGRILDVIFLSWSICSFWAVKLLELIKNMQFCQERIVTFLDPVYTIFLWKRDPLQLIARIEFIFDRIHYPFSNFGLIVHLWKHFGMHANPALTFSGEWDSARPAVRIKLKDLHGLCTVLTLYKDKDFSIHE